MANLLTSPAERLSEQVCSTEATIVVIHRKNAHASARICSDGMSSFSQFCFKTMMLWLCVIALSPMMAFAQPTDISSPGANPTTETGKPNDAIGDQQLSLSSRFKRFEETLRKIADYTRKTDPDRAELLYRAIGKSQGSQIPQQMEMIVKLLESQSFGDAELRQVDLITELQALLDVLQSENEKERLKKEIARVEDLIKDVNSVIGKQKDVRAETERGGKLDELEKRQQDVNRDAQKLGKKIDTQDAEKNAELNPEQKSSNSQNSSDKNKKSEDKNKPGDSKSGDSKDKPEDGKSEENRSGDMKPGEKKPADDKPSESKPGENKSGDNKPSEQKPGEQKPSESKPSSGKPKSGKPSDQNQEDQPEQSPSEQKSEQPDKTAGRDEIEQAKEKMEQAIKELKKKARSEASNKQDAAIAELEKAKAKLEELLRQLREEERELMLTALEARFRRMLEMQLRVRHSTFAITQTPEADRATRHAARGQQLALDEEEIILEAGKTLLILREDGGSVAFPEAVGQMKDDMTRVADRLKEMKFDDLTVSIEDEVIEALKEMVEALQKELEQMKQNQQQKKQQNGGEPPDPELVNKLNELKMLRSLQNRINRRTRQYGQQVEGEQATAPDILSMLRELSQRQARIQEATYGLAKGKNK